MSAQNNIPQATQFEKSVLGAILNEPDKLPEVVGILSPECFYEPENAKVYEVITQMYDANKPIDLFTVGKRYSDVHGVKLGVAISYLTGCTQLVGSGAHLVQHTRIVKDAHIRRSIITSAHKLIAKATDSTEDIADTLEYLSKTADITHEQSFGGATVRHIRESLSEALKACEGRQLATQSGETSGITTGLTELNSMTGGWQGGQLIILAARPAMGKSALMLHFAKEAAKSGTPVCLYSLEMSDISLANRLLLSESDVDADAFRSGRLTSDDWAKLENASARLQKLPVYIDANPVVSMRYIKSHSKIMKKRGQCGIIMVDYLQLTDTGSDKKNQNREREIAEASRQAKIIAKELDVPFILLSQLSRKCEERQDKTPMLSDLRESGAIEQDADIVSFIYRPAYYGVDTFSTRKYGDISTDGLGVLSIAKQRDGATGAIPFRHNPSMTRITDYESHVCNDEPF